MVIGPGGGGGGRPKSGESSTRKAIPAKVAAPELPWAKAVSAWMGNATQRVQIFSTFRQHYLEPDLVVNCSFYYLYTDRSNTVYLLCSIGDKALKMLTKENLN